MSHPLMKKDNLVYGEIVEDTDQNALGLLQKGKEISSTFEQVTREVNYCIEQFNHTIQNMENSNHRYIIAENNRKMIYNNEINKYNDLANRQLNLLNRINNVTIKLWRYQKSIYFRTSNGQLIIDNPIEVQKELSSRYGSDVFIVNDINDVLRNNNQYRVNTIFLAINNMIVIEEETFDINQPYEIFQTHNGSWKRNLLMYTRYSESNIINNIQSKTYTRSLMNTIVENLSDNKIESISQWIGNIGPRIDTILLLIGNKSISEDIVVNKTIKTLFDTGIVLSITDEVLSKQSLVEIINGKLFIHINHIPESEENQQKLKDLIMSLVIHKSIQCHGYTIQTQAKIIVTIDEPHPFFKDFLEISTALFIDTKENILKNQNAESILSIYQEMELSLSFYSNEIRIMPKTQLDIRENENQRYLESFNEVSTYSSITTESGLPILDPYSESYENIISNYERFKHTYIIANQGFGKSQLIISSIMRDYILNDCSVVLLDVHGDLGEDLLRIIPDKERLVYIDLYFDSSSMPSVNIFDSIDKNDEDSIYNGTQLTMSVFKNISSEDKLNGLMENVAENCISVMLREGGGSFWELYQFLGGAGSKDWIKLGKNSPNELEAYFFNNEFENESQTRAAVKRRLGKLIRDPKFSAFMNRKSTLNLEELVNTKGKIIIINIASGRMPNTYQYYMKFLVGYLQLIALKRVSILNKDDRVYTQLYLDEFHLFLDKSKILEEILTGARKYRMFLTFAHQTIAQIENSNLKEILTTIPTRYFIGNIANKSVEILNKAINTKLENTENLLPGEYYFKEDSKDPFKIQNTNRFLDGQEEISPEKLKETIQYQLKKYYEAINVKRKPQPTEDEINEMIQKFKADLISKNLTVSSCLYKLKAIEPKLLNEIEQNFEYKTIKEEKYTPRVLKRGIHEIFKLAFELDFIIDLDEFAKKITSQDEHDMFNSTDSGTRQKEFTNDGTSKTEQYYYFQS